MRNEGKEPVKGMEEGWEEMREGDGGGMGGDEGRGWRRDGRR